MKCNKCGQEFGKGTNCQYCGADKVAALGEFSGYSTPNNKPTTVKDSISSPASQHIEPITSQICWKCGEIIPLGKFCPVCGQALVRECPKCKKEYSTQYDICPNCGTNRIDYKKEQERLEIQRRINEEERRKKEQEAQQKRTDNLLDGADLLLKIFLFCLATFAFGVGFLLLLAIFGVKGDELLAISFIAGAIVAFLLFKKSNFMK